VLPERLLLLSAERKRESREREKGERVEKERRAERKERKKERKIKEREEAFLNKKLFIAVFVFWFVFCALCSRLQAAWLYSAVAFRDNVSYFSPDLSLYVQSRRAGANEVDFTFHNQRLTCCPCAAENYFESTVLLASASIINGPDTAFYRPAKPGNLPPADLLERVRGNSQFFFRQRSSFASKWIEPEPMASDYFQLGQWRRQ